MKFSVLIVDDSSTIRLILRRCLEQGELGVAEVVVPVEVGDLGNPSDTDW